MKRIIFSFLILTGFVSVINAQEPPAPKECVVQRNSFVCKELALTDQECELVSSYLNELDSKRIAMWKEHKQKTQQLKQKKTLSKEEVIAHLRQRTEWKIAENKLIEEYYTKLCNHISPEKVLLLDKVQRKFGRNMMKQLTDKKAFCQDFKQEKSRKEASQKRR